MSVDGWNTVLVLGGIRSGSSEFAGSLVRDRPAVRYVVPAARTGPAGPEQPTRTGSTRRVPADWTIEEIDIDPARLVSVIAGAAPDETLLVDDLGAWLTPPPDRDHDPVAVDELTAAIRDCPARLVVVSPEMGLSPVPAAPADRALVDAIGTANHAIAQVCDAVALVVAGQPTWLKPATAPASAPEPVRAVPTRAAPAEPVASPDVFAPATAPTTPVPAAPAGAAWTAPTTALPMVATGLVIQPGMELPMPDEYAGHDALERLTNLDLTGAGLGNLQRVVSFAARTQGTAVPTPWRSVRVLLLHGDHDGGAAAGATPGESARQADQARACRGPLAQLTAEIGGSLQVVEAPTAAPIEHGPAISSTAVESSLRFGWRLAEEAADAGVDLIVLAACGAGTEAAAVAVLAAASGAEPAAVLARIVKPGGKIDDVAWMTRCCTVRDALQRTRRAPRGAKEILAELGGGDIAVATGVLLGATARRTPVLLDGPVGVAAALVSRDLAGQARHWCLLPDHGGHPAVRFAADVLGLTPLIDLRLDVGEGTTALATLPLLRSALALAAAVPVHPTLAADTADRADAIDAVGAVGGEGIAPGGEPTGDARFVEPGPAGPGPTSAGEPADDLDGAVTEAATTPRI